MDGLLARGSEKWSTYPPDVLPACAAFFLERGRVALQPGLGFGAAQGAGFARLNVGTTGELVEEAVRRMAAALTP